MIKLLLEFFKIGLFTYGGGLAMIPLLRDISINNNWLSDSQFADLIAISQSTPGPIAINMATFIGYREASILGAILASIIIVTPAFILAIALSKVLAKYRSHPIVVSAFVGLKATVIGLIATSIIQVARVSLFEGGVNTPSELLSNFDYKAWAMLVISYLVIKKTQKHPLYYILGFGIISIFIW